MTSAPREVPAPDVRAAGADDRSRQTRGHKRREQILGEAVDLLSEKGFRGTSIVELADRVGMTHPGLLYYFGSKERLLREVVAERERAESAAFYGSLTDESASMSSLPEIARLIIGAPQFLRLFVVLAAENLDDGEPLHEFFVDRYERARRMVGHALSRDKHRGTVRADVDSAQVAREVVATLMGLELQWLMDPERIDYIATVDTYTESLRERLAP